VETGKKKEIELGVKPNEIFSVHPRNPRKGFPKTKTLAKPFQARFIGTRTHNC